MRLLDQRLFRGPETFNHEILPRLSTATAGDMARVTGLSRPYCSMRIGGGIALFRAGGSGPSRAQIQSDLMIAGYDGPDEGICAREPSPIPV